MLTKRQVDAARWDPSGPAQQFVWCDSVKGFGVRLGRTRKTFCVQFRTREGRSRRMTLGTFGALTVDEARTLARRHLHAAAEGADPAAEKRGAREGDTVRDLGAFYMAEHAKKHKRSWKEDQRILDRYVVPALGSRKVADVRRPDVVKLAATATTSSERNKVIALVSRMFGFATDHGLRSDELANPARGVGKHRIEPRERRARGHELPSLLAAIEAERNPHLRAYFVLLLLTGCRRMELLQARRADYDARTRELTLPATATKSKKARTVYLSTPAIELLESLPRSVSPYLFPSSKVAGQPIREPKRAWAHVKARMAAEIGDAEPLRLHDLRRTVAAMLADAGESELLIAAVLGHAPSGVTASHYALIGPEAVRAALERHAERVLGARTAARASGAGR